MGRYHYVFPRWSNLLLPTTLLVGAVAPLYVVMVVAYGFSPKTTDVGYRPVQPIPFSHKLHAGDLGMDCRYCHNTVEHGAMAAIPPTTTCMNCHTQVVKDSPVLEPLRQSYASGEPIEWVRVHDLPDYSYFDHSAHVRRGVSCVSCHGRIDRMEVVQQQETLSMGWCLSCHRNPEPHLRDPDEVTNLGWTFDGTRQEEAAYREHWREFNNLNPGQDCSICHR
ncbi:MAG: cytochrome c3 family protein [Planctomycetota bacterium]|jgi:hypothetical protein